MSDTQPFVAEFALDADSYRRVLLVRSVGRVRFLAPIVAFFGFAALGAGRTTEAFALLGGLAGVALGIWFYVAWVVHSPAMSSVYHRVRLSFTEEGIVHSSEDGEGTIPWQVVRRWDVVARHYLFFVAGANFLLVPAAAIEPADHVRLEALLRAHVAKGPRRR